MAEVVLKLFLFFLGLLLLLRNGLMRMRIVPSHIFWSPSRRIIPKDGLTLLILGFLSLFFLFSLRLLFFELLQLFLLSFFLSFDRGQSLFFCFFGLPFLLLFLQLFLRLCFGNGSFRFFLLFELHFFFFGCQFCLLHLHFGLESFCSGGFFDSRMAIIVITH